MASGMAIGGPGTRTRSVKAPNAGGMVTDWTAAGESTVRRNIVWGAEAQYPHTEYSSVAFGGGPGGEKGGREGHG